MGVVIAHYREVGLKGRNRSYFERILCANISGALKAAGCDAKVQAISGRVLVRLGPDEHHRAPDALKTVFGLSSFSFCTELTDPAIDDLSREAIALADKDQFESFRIRARRGRSSFPESSQIVNEAVGAAVETHTGARVDLSHANWTCHIELVANKAYLYTEKIAGPGGLPLSTAGKVMALLSGGIDSPVAAWQMGRRGAQVDFVHFHGQPYSDPSSARQAERLARRLMPWLVRSQLWLIPFGDIQSEIVTNAPEQLRIILYRRYMMRIAERLAAQVGAESLVTGESLGQVASQTLPNIAATDSVVENMPVFRPLIGFDKLDIETLAKQIGTYEISIEAHQDCCVLFTPRRVATAAKADDLTRAELALDTEAFVEKALANAETIELRHQQA